MLPSLQVTFRGIAHSEALDVHLQERAGRLNQVFEHVLWCHVVVELDGHHHRKGDRYRISINLGLPGHEFVVTRGSSMGNEDESPYQSTDRAFDEAARQIKDWVRRRRSHRREGLRESFSKETRK